MKMPRIVGWARDIDARLQRWRSPHTRRLLVNLHSPMEYPIVAPVYKSMSGDRRVQFFFTSTGEPGRIAEIYREAGSGAPLIDPRRAALMKFDACLCADMPWGRFPRGVRRVQMFHGVAGKYSDMIDSPLRSMRKWHRLFFINRRRMRNYFASGAIDAGSPAARLVGMPKADRLVDGTLERDAVLRSLGLDPARKSVLYAPTWSRYSSLNAMGEDLVRLLCAAGYTVIVKLHENSRLLRDLHSGGIDWVARLEPILGEGGGLLATGTDAGPYLAAADLLITDHSSVGFEYMLLNRPLVRIEMPELIKHTNINTEYVELLAEASTTVRDPQGALRAAGAGLADPGRKSETRKAVAEELFHRPGTATQRAVSELYEVLELEALERAPAALPAVPRAPLTSPRA